MIMSAVTEGRVHVSVCVRDRSANAAENLFGNVTNILCIAVQWSLATLIIASSDWRQITCLCVTAFAGRHAGSGSTSRVHLKLMRWNMYSCRKK